MKKIICLLLAVCSFVGMVRSQEVKQKVAVYVTGGVDGAYKKIIGSKLVVGITQSDEYVAVERTADFLSALSQEQDYQQSGVVSDNQIVKLGQQFGVRYVLIADVSELFESLFISARMIDVETAQIIKSGDASQAVKSIEDLEKISENIVLTIIGVPDFTEETVKFLGSYSSFDALWSCKVPKGYHIATKEEVDVIIKNFQLIGEKLSFPIYASVIAKKNSLTQYYTVEFYKNLDARTHNAWTKSRNYYEHRLTCTLIEDATKSSILNLSYVNDNNYEKDNADVNRTWYDERDNHYKRVCRDISNMSTPRPNITPGYVYIVKNKDK